MFYDILPTESRGYIFVKIQLFVTAKSDQDPDLHGSALVQIPSSGSGSGPALRKKAGSEFGSRLALKPMRIRNTFFS